MTSVYWTETDPDGVETRVRKCKNSPCPAVLYFSEASGKFMDFATRKPHVCSFYNKGSSTSASTTSEPGAQTSIPNNKDDPTHIQKIEEYSLIQVEELKRHTDLLERQKEDTDLMAQYLRTIATILKNIDEKLDSKLKEQNHQEEDLQ